MIDEHLRARGISDERVLGAMERVPRHEFVKRGFRGDSYADRPLPIPGGQTISQPYMVAFTLAEARLTGEERLLDIGTGSGYAAAVAAELTREVVSVERLPELARSARRRLARLGYSRVSVVTADGSLGWADGAPYDVIVAAAAGPRIPEAWKQQLAPGGRIVAPIGPEDDQWLVRVTQAGGRWNTERLERVRYVPLIGKQGRAER